jgi:hypothetical protein
MTTAQELIDSFDPEEGFMEEGMDELEAREMMEVNVTAAYVGEGTPAFATVYRPPNLASQDW